MTENQSDQSQQPLDLTLFTKELFSEHATFDLEKNPNSESYFEPIPNGFYGFAIPIPFYWPPLTHIGDEGIIYQKPETLDIDFEDVTHKKIA